MNTEPQSPPPIRKLSDDLNDFQQNIVGDVVTIDELIYLMEERGIAMLLFMLAVPMALPIPVPPGINVALAMPLILLTAQQAWGSKKIWLPKRIREKSIQKSKVIALFSAASPWVRRIEFFVTPRLSFLTENTGKHIVGVCGLIMALAICIPLPMTNTVPSLGIACMSMGILMRDGLALLTGVAIGVGWITLLVILGEAGMELFIDLIKSYV